MNILDLTKDELLAIDNYSPTGDFGGIVIVPTGELHDSGFQMMKFILCDGYNVVGATSGYSDVLHLDGIGGYGLDYKSAMVNMKNHVVDWSVDVLPKSGCVRLFIGRRFKGLKLPNFYGSDFEIYVEDKKMKYTIILPENTKFFNITYEDGTTELITVGEKRVKVTPYKIIKECPECGGEMESVGTASLTSPIMYKHRCKECGYEESYKHVYPRIEYVEEE